MVEILYEDDDLDVLIGGRSIGILDTAENYVLAECELEALVDEHAGKGPAELELQVQSSDGFGTYFFHELHIVANDDSVALYFVCHTPHKYCEGHYVLAAFIDALREQANSADNLQVTHLHLED